MSIMASTENACASITVRGCSNGGRCGGRNGGSWFCNTHDMDKQQVRIYVVPNVQEAYGNGRHKPTTVSVDRIGHVPLFGVGGSFRWVFASAKVFTCCATA